MARHPAAQAQVDPDAVPRTAFVLDTRYEGSDGPWHSHRRAQLVHAAEGVLTITTPTGRWIAPPERAVWVPPGMPHSVASRRPFRLLTLYVEPDVAPLPRACRVVAVDRLVEELLRAAAKFGATYALGGAEERLVRVILDRLPELDVSRVLHLPEPTSRELRRITRALVSHPAADKTLEEWASTVALTKRTASRRFLAETGMTFGRWRKQLRLLIALERLAAGESVTSIALEVGYEDVSSFISVFKAAFGKTPAKYFDDSFAALDPGRARSDS